MSNSKIPVNVLYEEQKEYDSSQTQQYLLQHTNSKNEALIFINAATDDC